MKKGINSKSTLGLEKRRIKNLAGRLRVLRLKAQKPVAIALLLCAVFLVASCNSSSEKLALAKEDLADANKDLTKAQQAYADDIKEFKKDAEKKIESNETLIEELGAKIEKSQSKLSAEYQKQVTALEKKNKEMKKQINDYQEDTKEGWEKFKKEFSQDIDELGTALKNFSMNN